jgi:outer membrane protein assembly factor BamB/predicted Ser/Thr protein kinase
MSEPELTIDQPGRKSTSDAETFPPPGSVAELVSLLDRYVTDLNAGRNPDRRKLLADHPDLAAQLEACLGGIELVHRVTGGAETELAQLGEFRIIREIGRGGMGVVYEAEQTSLRRRVALKVLNFGPAADAEAMLRFRREAETVGRLHHTNIVPIFAVGVERGVSYYAMQFIEGRSLADVAAEALQSKRLLAVSDVVGWGLQAAEALAHAHQRRVVHRDIKPSNLLIDDEGVVWLTDFGLAKRDDEVSLTVTGALMGTPRYMSPEQAEALQDRIDHRTDVYSLGASLYELATGRPVFESLTPLRVIEQVLTQEPKRPRELRKTLPRDLETVILTCLAKDPAKRYATAQALADDLRAVLENRPIQARRVSMAERFVRYVRRQRRALGVAGITAAASVALMAAVAGGWTWYQNWRLGHIVLTTDGAPLTAQVLADSSDDTIGEPFSVGTKTAVSYPDGDYRIRLTGKGLLGQTFRLAVNRGETRTQPVTLDDDRLLGSAPLTYHRVSSAFRLSGNKSELVEWTGDSLVRRDGATGKPTWDLARPGRPISPDRDVAAWVRRLSFHGDPDQPAVLVKPAPDLDHDGTGDIVFAFSGTPSYLAVSGKDGSMLWTYTAAVDGPGGPDRRGPDLPATIEQFPQLGRVLGAPATEDLDGDGIPDLIALFAFYDTDQQSNVQYPDGRRRVIEVDRPGRRSLVAVSGREGRWLWSRPIDAKSVTITPAMSARGVLLAHAGGGAAIVVHDGARAVVFHGTARGPVAADIELGFVPVRPLQLADLDGDGEPEVLALGPGQLKAGDQTLGAWSSRTGELLWREQVRGAYSTYDWLPPMAWPLVEDLDGDGKAEVVIPDWGPLPPSNGYRGVRMLEGATGVTRWTRPMRPYTRASDGVIHIVAAPDVTGDGVSELVAVSQFDGRRPFTLFEGVRPEPRRFYVDMLSGSDGRPLWWWNADLPEESNVSWAAWPPVWWGRGADGWPMLAVPLGGSMMAESPNLVSFVWTVPPEVRMLSASDGRDRHTIPGLFRPSAADLDGDGLDDLIGSADGTWRAFRATTPEEWRALGEFRPAADFDGDGVVDVLNEGLRAKSSFADQRTLVARSGRDGHVLWRTLVDPEKDWNRDGEDTTYHAVAAPARNGDLDGDGAPDVIVTVSKLVTTIGRGGGASIPLAAISGRSGRSLWSAGRLPLGFAASGHTRVVGFEVRSAEHGARPDVFVLHASPFGKPGAVPIGATHEDTRLARLSGGDGHVIWDRSIVVRQAPALAARNGFARAVGDLDGDGALDIAMAVQVLDRSGADGLELRAVALRDGRELWSHRLRSTSQAFPALAAGDLDGDGRAEVLVTDAPPMGDPASVELRALDGRDGSTRWTWLGGSDRDRQPAPSVPLVLADFEGRGVRTVCLNAGIVNGGRRLKILDAHGGERAGRDLTPSGSIALASADLDGDGREELLVHYDGKLRALRSDLAERWAWPTTELIREVIPAARERPATVVLSSFLALDGSTGRPRWLGSPSRGVLDAGDGPTRPKLLAGPLETTICRAALPASRQGTFTAARGEPPPALRRTDPRWVKPLPWGPTGSANQHPLVYLVLAGLALANLVLPWSILRLASRRRIASVRTLLALPVAIGIPLVVYLALRARFPDFAGYSTAILIGALMLVSLAGLPILAFATSLGASVLRRRWRRLAILLGLTVMVALVLGGLQLRSDMRTMAAVERYAWSGWYWLAAEGAYGMGVLLLLAQIVSAGHRVAMRRRIKRISHG